MAALAAAEPYRPRAASHSHSSASGSSRSDGQRRRSGPRTAQDAPLRIMDLGLVIKLLESSGSFSNPDTSKDLEKEQLKTLKKVVKHFEYGLPIEDVAQINKILNLCAEKVNEQEAFTEPLCELIKVFGLPFQKKKSADELNYSGEVSQSIAQLGYLMRVPSSQVKVQICKCVISFYNMEPPGKFLPGYQPASANYKIEMAELGGLAETLSLSLALVENQLTEKLWVLEALQRLSVSEINCGLMIKAQAASRLCLYLNGADPSGQLMFRSSDILWNLLESTSKEEVVNQLRSLECVCALQEAFVDLLMHGFRCCDRQLRNDLLVIATLLAENPAAAMIESGFAELLIVLATFDEVKLQNPLVKGFKLTYSSEDFEMKKLLFHVVGVLSKDPSAVQLLTENHVMPALLYYVKPNQKPGFPGWSAAQYEELQLHAIAVLASVAPVLVDKYLSYQGNTLLLVFLEWCAGQEPFFGQGNSFHGTGGRGNKLAQMRYGLRALRCVVSLCNDAVNINLCDQGGISQLLDVLKYAANKSKEKEDAIILEIQADILFILSVLCENYFHRKMSPMVQEPQLMVLGTVRMQNQKLRNPLELFSSQGTGILIPFFRMDPKKLCSGLGHSCLLFSALDCLWSCVIGCVIAEDSFIEKQGIFLLLDLLALKEKELSRVILGILVEFCGNPKTTLHISTWRGKRDQTAANLLIQLWREEELDLGVGRDQCGRIVDIKRPLATSFQKEHKIIPLPANCPTFAIMEVSEGIRAKIYSLFCKIEIKPLPPKCNILAYQVIGRLTEPFISKDFSIERMYYGETGAFYQQKPAQDQVTDWCMCDEDFACFENLPGLPAKDFVTLAIIQRYLDFKIGEAWSEICVEIKQEFRPIASDEKALEIISKLSEDTAKSVVALQNEVLESQHHHDIQEEEKTKKEFQAPHIQTGSINKSWKNFMTRTSDYEALKKAKLLQKTSIQASRCKAKIENEPYHSTDIPYLHTTIAPGHSVAMESTPHQYIDGTLAVTNHALRKSLVCNGALKNKRDKTLDSVNKKSVSVE